MFKLCIYWEYDAIPSWWLGWVLIFVRWRFKTYLRRFYVHWRKKTHLRRFSNGVYKEGSLNSWRSHTFHLVQSCFPFQVFFPLKNPFPSDNWHGGRKGVFESYLGIPLNSNGAKILSCSTEILWISTIKNIFMNKEENLLQKKTTTIIWYVLWIIIRRKIQWRSIH